MVVRAARVLCGLLAIGIVAAAAALGSVTAIGIDRDVDPSPAIGTSGSTGPSEAEVRAAGDAFVRCAALGGVAIDHFVVDVTRYDVSVQYDHAAGAADQDAAVERCHIPFDSVRQAYVDAAGVPVEELDRRNDECLARGGDPVDCRVAANHAVLGTG